MSEPRLFPTKEPRDRTPTHIHAEPGDRYSLCGVKDALPVIWAPFVQRHVDGYGMVVCPECAACSP